jgi:hypothetical protein
VTGVFFLLTIWPYNSYMEFAIGIGIGVIIALIAAKRKKRGTMQSRSGSGAKTEHDRRQKVDEELITVILPTINHDK